MQPFIFHKGIQLGQTPKTLDIFSQFIQDFDLILELGFHQGGLSSWLYENKKPQSQLYCFDITREFLQSNDSINFIISDLFHESTQSTIRDLIQNGKKTLVLCDGGNKELEFKIYSHFLKTNDVILIHDFCETPQEYQQHQIQVNWPSPPESFYQNILPIIEEYNLKPFHYDNLKSCFWGGFIKHSTN